jgi:hypothetical protein
VVWATGYRSDHAWIHVPGVLDRAGRVVHRRGVTDVPGLYFLGLSWQHTRGSALLGFVDDDAAYLADRIAAHQRSGGAAGAAGSAPWRRQPASSSRRPTATPNAITSQRRAWSLRRRARTTPSWPPSRLVTAMIATATQRTSAKRMK